LGFEPGEAVVVEFVAEPNDSCAVDAGFLRKGLNGTQHQGSRVGEHDLGKHVSLRRQERHPIA
jgi:hypothetical protein